MQGFEKFSADEVAQALTDNRGFISITARRLGCTVQTVRNYVRRYASCRDALHESREAMKDYTEGKLYEQISLGNITAIIFYLKTQAKDRGYDQDNLTILEGNVVQVQRIEVNLPPMIEPNDSKQLPG